MLILFLHLSSMRKVPIKSKGFDWRDRGAILPVPDQGTGRDAGILNVLATLSAKHYQRSGGQLVKLSDQQVYDCQDSWCPGSHVKDPLSVYDFLMKGIGMASEQSYPYTGHCEHKCPKNVTVVTRLGGVAKTGHPGEEDIMETFLSNGPVVATVRVGRLWETYTGGVFDNIGDCPGDGDYNHNVLVVGYGEDPTGVKYWIARNSWGPNWGENGYIRLIRNKNMCGIGNHFGQPVLAS
ncbi:uncharacterized protein LOC128953110 [Oppia nitens]|uniref:uncharacterized protein LOC128953110 n=1 Tax=Oppia nitens TaxID=1686743 RepID=UPI0023DAB97C|nr:uncharacterized protein LOC128953110 [Oppia nitens]